MVWRSRHLKLPDKFNGAGRLSARIYAAFLPSAPRTARVIIGSVFSQHCAVCMLASSNSTAVPQAAKRLFKFSSRLANGHDHPIIGFAELRTAPGGCPRSLAESPRMVVVGGGGA